MINTILIYAGITLISWLIFMLFLFVSLEAIDYVIQQWSNYGN